MKYVGARYVPKFMGSFDITQSYEALCVVDNGMGTSYISIKPTPAGTPLTNTAYWTVYGASSGAIINLQDQIDDITKYDVKKYGAKGDGVTEDSQAFVDCLAANDICYIPSGVYLVNNLEIVSNKCLIGDSSGSVELKLLNSANNPLLYANNADNVTIKNITFNGNKGNQTAAANLLSFNGGSHLTFSNNLVKDGRGTNLYIVGATHVLIEDSEFSGSYAGCGIILSYNDNPQFGVVKNVYSHDNEVDGLTCTGEYNTITDSTFINNGLQNLPDTAPSCGIYLDSHSSNCIIKNNVSNDNSFSGIELSGTNNCIVSGNTCDDNDANGIYVGEGSYNLITGNQCKGNKATNNTMFGGIYVGAWDPNNQCTKNIITGNYVDGSSLSNYGIILNNGSLCSVIGNEVSFATTSKVYNNGSSNTILNDRVDNVLNSATLLLNCDSSDIASLYTYSSASNEGISFNKPDLYLKYTSGGNVNLHAKGVFADGQIETTDYIRAGNIEDSGSLSGKNTGYLFGFKNLRLPSAADDYQQGNVYVDNSGLHVFYDSSWHLMATT